jgi:hypothetical protein
MDLLREFLEDLKRRGLVQGHFRGLLHLLIGRRLEKADGTLISQGLTWRDLAALLKRVRWEKEDVVELGLNPADLPPRDRQRYWYVAITQAQVDSPQAFQDADALAEQLTAAGYRVGAAPGGPR